jgi:alpha-ketoglutarate-dependent 2,4-dichlorophenoxyacetate dioxygenase|tara:strand:- start:1664 stop:2554 length:891 start_codon:yes stop_codon:yes gene_type:complete
MVQVTPVQGDFVAVVDNVDLAYPLNDDEFAAVEMAFETYGVIVFPAQDITDDQQIAFSRRFGPLEPSVRRHRNRAVSNVFLSDISNVGSDGQIMAEKSEAMSYNRGNQLWHSDSSFKEIPSKASLLSAREVPPSGGETEFADMRAAWDTLSAEKQVEISDLVAQHSLAYSRATMGYDAGEKFMDVEKSEVPPVPQPLIRVSPVTGRKSLYVGSHAAYVDGMDRNAGRTLLDGLLAHAAEDRFIYIHNWAAFDLVMWDNRCINHRGRPWQSQKHRRVMRRTTIGGDGFDEAAALAIG